MSDPKTIHSTFVIERTYPVPAARVFAAWADPAAKARWFNGPAAVWQEIERQNDFRVGGHDRLLGAFKTTGTTSLFTATYLDIVPETRVIYSYEMAVDGKKISASLATIELIPVPEGTRMVLTEQGAYFDQPNDAAAREHGTTALMDQLGASLGFPSAAAAPHPAPQR